MELGPLGLFRGRERLFFRFRVAFLLYIRAPEELNLLVRGRQSDTLITTFGTQCARASVRTCSAYAHAPLSDQRETLVGLPIDAAEPVFYPHIKQVYGSIGLCFGGWSSSFADSTALSCSIPWLVRSEWRVRGAPGPHLLAYPWQLTIFDLGRPS